MPRELQRATVAAVQAVLPDATLTFEDAPPWLLRPGKAECKARWSLVRSIYEQLTGLDLPDEMPSRESRRADAMIQRQATAVSAAGRAAPAARIPRRARRPPTGRARLGAHPSDCRLRGSGVDRRPPCCRPDARTARASTVSGPRRVWGDRDDARHEQSTSGEPALHEVSIVHVCHGKWGVCRVARQRGVDCSCGRGARGVSAAGRRRAAAAGSSPSRCGRRRARGESRRARARRAGGPCSGSTARRRRPGR
jgi:hypothetical protein